MKYCIENNVSCLLCSHLRFHCSQDPKEFFSFVGCGWSGLAALPTLLGIAGVLSLCSSLLVVQTPGQLQMPWFLQDGCSGHEARKRLFPLCCSEGCCALGWHESTLLIWVPGDTDFQVVTSAFCFP